MTPEFKKSVEDRRNKAIKDKRRKFLKRLRDTQKEQGIALIKGRTRAREILVNLKVRGRRVSKSTK